MHLTTRVIVYIAVAVFAWDLIWKAFALWRAGRNRQPVWYFFLFFITSVGLLPIIYLLLYPLDDDREDRKRH